MDDDQSARAFAFCISDSADKADVAGGYVRAADVAEALVLVGDRRANAFALPEDFHWPAEAEGLGVYCLSRLASRELNSLGVPEG